MDSDPGRFEIGQGDRFLNPQQHVVARAAHVVAMVMVQRQIGDGAGPEQDDGFLRPEHEFPSRRQLAHIVKKDLPDGQAAATSAGMITPASPTS